MSERPEFDYGRFELLSNGFKSGALVVEPLDPEWDSDGAWDSYDLLAGRFVPPRPLRFRRAEGKRAYDFVLTTFGMLPLISQRVVDALSERGVSGWRVFPVEVEDGKGQPVEGLHGLSITGISGAPVEGWSEVVTVPAPTPQGRPAQKLKGLFFDPEGWDGSDLFVPEGSAYVIGSDRVADALRDIDATNVELTPVTEVLQPILRSRSQA
jgi:hypothetical protein